MWIDLENITLREVRQKKLKTIWLHSHVCYITKSNKWPNKQTKQNTKLPHRLRHHYGDYQRGWGRMKGKRGQIYVDGRRLDFGWWAHYEIWSSCNIEMYTGDQYDFNNKCHSNKFNKKEKWNLLWSSVVSVLWRHRGMNKLARFSWVDMFNDIKMEHRSWKDCNSYKKVIQILIEFHFWYNIVM